MRVCLVSHEYPPETASGGIGSQTWNKAHALTALGHHVEVLSATGASEGSSTEASERLLVHRIPTPDCPTPLFTTEAYWYGYSWRILEALSALHSSNPFDVVDFPDYTAEGLAFLLNRTQWNWVPTVVQLHGPLAMFRDHVGWPEPGSAFATVGTTMEHYAIKSADRLMACSANIANFVAEKLHIPVGDIDVVYCGVDVETFVPAPHVAKANGPFRVLFAGNLATSKGLQTVFDAVVGLHRSGVPVCLLVAGGTGDEPLLASLQRESDRLGSPALLEYVGFVRDRQAMADLYRSADVFCSPATHELGVANVYIEAMASGIPVVAADTGGAPEAIVHGSTGYLVQPGDREGLQATLKLLAEDPGLRFDVGNAGRRRAEAVFAMDKYIARVIHVYEKAIALGEPRRSHTNTGGR